MKEGIDKKDFILDEERRAFLKLGLKITGVVAGGMFLSVAPLSPEEARAVMPEPMAYSRALKGYKHHYCMVMIQNNCIDCERCKEACAKTNHVPSYGWRTTILERRVEVEPGNFVTEFIPTLCHHCVTPPCVRVCPTKATYKDKKTGIVMMNYKKCIGCKTCMEACPYNARYFNEEKRAIDKCNFCFDTRLSKGEKEPACVAACPAKVRHFGDLLDPNSEVYRLIHQPERTVWVLRPEVGTKPVIFYIKG